MVDYHTREKISHEGKRISPKTKSRVIFFFQSVVIYQKILLVEIIVVVALFRYVHSVSHWLTDSNKNSKSSLLLAFSIIKNILPLVEIN
jgi:type III secretory pathway component EscU